MWALIENGAVKEVTDIDPGGRFHPDLNWIECPAGCSAGWEVRDGNIYPPIPVIAESTRDEIDAARKISYADPLTGSDRLFAEAMRMQLMGEPGLDVVVEAGAARYEEIRSQFPWPE